MNQRNETAPTGATSSPAITVDRFPESAYHSATVAVDAWTPGWRSKSHVEADSCTAQATPARAAAWGENTQRRALSILSRSRASQPVPVAAFAHRRFLPPATIFSATGVDCSAHSEMPRSYSIPHSSTIARSFSAGCDGGMVS